MIAEGTYRARANGAVLGRSSTGKEQVQVAWKVQMPDGSVQGIGSYHYFSTDEAIRISLEQLRTAGWTGTDLSDLRSLCPAADFEPPEVDLVIVHETYEGKVRAKVKFINSAGGVGLSEPLPINEAKAFAARMRGAIVAFDQARNGGQPAVTRPRPPKAAQPKAEPTRAEVQAAHDLYRGPAPRVTHVGPGMDDAAPFQATDEDLPF